MTVIGKKVVVEQKKKKRLDTMPSPGPPNPGIGQDDARSIFRFLHQNTILPGHLEIKIIPMPFENQLTPPSYEYKGT